MQRRILWLTLTGLGISLLAVSVVFQNNFTAVEQLIPAIPAKTTSSFVDSLGFGVHLWAPPISIDNYVSALNDLNVHYIRDDLQISYAQYQAFGQTWLNKIRQLHDNGVQTLAIANELRVSPADVVQYVKESQGSIYAVEGPNEVDTQCYPNGTAFTGEISYPCPRALWLARSEEYVTNLKTALRADPATSNIALYSPSISALNYQVGSTVFTSNSDYGNVHYYPYIAGNNVDSIHNEATSAQNGLYPGKPMVLTEIGYPSSPMAEFGSRPTDETWQAKILPLYWLEAYKEGIAKTFLYELIDSDATDHWSPIDYQGRKKPAYFALKNLIDVLKDTGTAFSPGSLRYSLEGNVSGVSSLLFQKHDGRFYLALWQSSLAASPVPGPTTLVVNKNISLRLGDLVGQVKTISPVDGQGTIQTFNQPSLVSNLTVGDKPLLLEIQPPPNTPTGASSATGSTSTGKSTTTNKAKKSAGTVIGTPTPPENSTSITPEPTFTDSLALPTSNTQVKIGFWRWLANFFILVFHRIFSWF